MPLAPHLAAMQMAMMRETSTVPVERPVPRFQQSRTVSPAQMITALRTSLIAERKARLAAEARLRAVLEHVARTAVSNRVHDRPMIEMPALPAASEEIVEVEATTVHTSPVSDIKMAILDVGGDDSEDEEDAYGD